MNDAILQEISEFCRQAGLAEFTFGRRAVNDGKLASRLRNGGRITTETLDRIRGFMTSHRASPRRRAAGDRAQPVLRAPLPPRARCRSARAPARTIRSAISASSTTGRNICCSSTPAAKSGWSRAASRSSSATSIRARRRCACSTPASATAPCSPRVMRAMHDRFPHMPFYVVGKEISLEDVRLTLQKMADRFFEHPRPCWSSPTWTTRRRRGWRVKSLSAASSMVWHEVPLAGNTAHEFEQQITELEPFLAENWKARREPEDRQPGLRAAGRAGDLPRRPPFLLDPIIPRPGGTVANYDLVIASQPYRRARLGRLQGEARDRAARARARPRRAAARHPLLRPRSRPGDHPEGLAGRQSVHARPPRDPQGREARARAAPAAISTSTPMPTTARCSATTCTRCRRKCRNRSAPRPLFAAWNAAIYVAQIEDDRLGERRQRRALSRRHARGAAQARRAVVLRRVLRDLAPARLSDARKSANRCSPASHRQK